MFGLNPKLANLILYVSGHPKVKNLGKTKLYKLIYFIDTCSLRDTGQSVTGSEFIKYEHGPVPSRAEKAIKRLIKNDALSTRVVSVGGLKLEKLTPLLEPNLDEFSPEELATVDAVLKKYGAKSARDLSNISHEEPAWRYAGMQEKLAPELMMYGAAEDLDGL